MARRGHHLHLLRGAKHFSTKNALPVKRGIRADATETVTIAPNTTVTDTADGITVMDISTVVSAEATAEQRVSAAETKINPRLIMTHCTWSLTLRYICGIIVS